MASRATCQRRPARQDRSSASSSPAQRAPTVADLGIHEGGALRDLVALPFIFVAAEARIAWEPRYRLCAGPRLEPLDRYVELTPMREPWAEHRLRVTELGTLDHAALAAVRTGCRVGPHVPLASLEDAAPWHALYGRPLTPFDRFVRHLGVDLEGPDDAAPPSVLRQTAPIAATLVLPSPAHTPFLHLLAARRCHDAAAGARGRCARRGARPRNHARASVRPHLRTCSTRSITPPPTLASWSYQHPLLRSTLRLPQPP